MTKPTTAEGYVAGLAAEARRLCLYVATVLGDLADDIVVVGGLVPYLIVDQETVEVPHVGTPPPRSRSGKTCACSWTRSPREPKPGPRSGRR